MKRFLTTLVISMAFVFWAGCGSPTPRSNVALPSVEIASPDFTLPGTHGEAVTLSSKVAEGPVVLVFYRGHW